jgi:4-hydroxy-3-methylbut-2-en-1-yl diphosphate reductase
MPSLSFAVPLRIEALALRAGWPGAPVLHTGMGPARARVAAAKLGDDALVVGVCGALDPSLKPGDVVVATELRGPGGDPLPSPGDAVAEALQSAGLRVRRGPIVSTERLGRRPQGDALAVDMESWWLAAGRPLAVARAVVDTPSRPLVSPLTLLSGPRALVSLQRMGRALRQTEAREVDLCPSR